MFCYNNFSRAPICCYNNKCSLEPTLVYLIPSRNKEKEFHSSHRGPKEDVPTGDKLHYDTLKSCFQCRRPVVKDFP